MQNSLFHNRMQNFHLPSSISLTLPRRQANMVKDDTNNDNILKVAQFKDIINPEGFKISLLIQK